MASGMAARDRGDHALAEKLFRRALTANPHDARVQNNLGELLASRGRKEEAEGHLRRAVELDPGYANAWNNLGNVLVGFKSRDAEARDAFESALAANPKHVPSLYNYATLLQGSGEPAQSKAMLERAVAADPTHLKSLLALHHQSKQQCDWADYSDHQDKILQLARNPACRPFTPFPLLSVYSTLEDQHRSAKRYSETLAVPRARRLPPQRPRPGSPIRIGYLSRDYYQHATAALIIEVFEKHDRDRFEIWGVDHSPNDGTSMRQRVLSSFDRVLNIKGMSDEAAAGAIHEAQIDILVDLKGYTKNTRSRILAYRPAPIQVNYLGYPGTLGADFVDYILADPVVAPFEHQPFYAERIVHLPDCYQPNDRNREVGLAPSRSDYGLPEDAFVFCCLNNTYKISPGMFDAWMRVLQAVPFSVLWLYEKRQAVALNLRREAEARGVDAERLIFAPPVEMDEHIARLPLADLFLDTLPYNAHTTASEAIWAGLPILTCTGPTFAGRVCASILRAAGLPELITDSMAEYEEQALALARDRGQLSEIRSKIERTRLTMPLFDTDRFTAGLEDAYDQMWRLWADGQRPRQITASAGSGGRVRPTRTSAPPSVSEVALITPAITTPAPTTPPLITPVATTAALITPAVTTPSETTPALAGPTAETMLLVLPH